MVTGATGQPQLWVWVGSSGWEPRVDGESTQGDRLHVNRGKNNQHRNHPKGNPKRARLKAEGLSSQRLDGTAASS